MGILQELVEQHIPIESRMFGLRESSGWHEVAKALVLVSRGQMDDAGEHLYERWLVWEPGGSARPTRPDARGLRP